MHVVKNLDLVKEMNGQLSDAGEQNLSFDIRDPTSLKGSSPFSHQRIPKSIFYLPKELSQKSYTRVELVFDTILTVQILTEQFAVMLSIQNMVFENIKT